MAADHIKFALLATLKVRPGKEVEVASFLRSALATVEQEPGTLQWYAIQFNTDTFGIFDTFADEAGRDAHLNGDVAKALMERAPDLFAIDPEIKKLSVLAAK
jgi:quinol monooxygenase YgiN